MITISSKDCSSRVFAGLCNFLYIAKIEYELDLWSSPQTVTFLKFENIHEIDLLRTKNVGNKTVPALIGLLETNGIRVERKKETYQSILEQRRLAKVNKLSSVWFSLGLDDQNLFLQLANLKRR